MNCSARAPVKCQKGTGEIARGTHPPVFLPKSAYATQNNGFAPNVGLKRVRKLLKRKVSCFDKECTELCPREADDLETGLRARMSSPAGLNDSNSRGIHELSYYLNINLSIGNFSLYAACQK
jgi:hypothetical protein